MQNKMVNLKAKQRVVIDGRVLDLGGEADSRWAVLEVPGATQTRLQMPLSAIPEGAGEGDVVPLTCTVTKIWDEKVAPTTRVSLAVDGYTKSRLTVHARSVRPA